MTHTSLNVTLGTISLLTMLVGLLFLHSPMIATPLTGVGGSVLATALVNWILTRPLQALPITSIVEALARSTPFMRLQHEAELVFRIENGMVRLDKRHRYCLRNPSRYVRSHRISLFDDSPAIQSARGGFQLVVEPDGTTVDGEALKRYVRTDSGKYVFTKTYDLQPGDTNAFEFRSYAYYRMADRLIWTVQELSDNFRVRIVNMTGQPHAFDIKVNHHREEAIKTQIKDLRTSNEILVDFNAEILPYQGFEVMWNLTAA
jgi:hypothetical protein